LKPCAKFYNPRTAPCPSGRKVCDQERNKK
jgi:hypothetical protein